MAARLVDMPEADQVLLELEGAAEDRLRLIGTALPEMDAAELLERLGHAGAVGAVDLLAHAHGLGVVAQRQGQVADRLGDQAEGVVVDAGLLVVGPELADEERQGLLGKAQRLGVVAGAVEGVGGVAQLLQLAGELLGADARRN